MARLVDCQRHVNNQTIEPSNHQVNWTFQLLPYFCPTTYITCTITQSLQFFMQEIEIRLFQQIKADSQTAFDKLFHLYYEQLVQQAYALTQNQADAEDIAQAVFIDLWAKRNQLTIQQSVGAYLHKMVHHRCMDYFRQLKSRTNKEIRYAENTLHLSIASPEEDLLKEENITAIYQKIEALPSKCKIVFKLSRFEELSYEEVATQLGISKKTVEYHISTALKLLRKSIFGITFLLIENNYL